VRLFYCGRRMVDASEKKIARCVYLSVAHLHFESAAPALNLPVWAKLKRHN
jgi:hypothetical protein